MARFLLIPRLERLGQFRSEPEQPLVAKHPESSFLLTAILCWAFDSGSFLHWSLSNLQGVYGMISLNVLALVEVLPPLGGEV